MKSRKQLFNEKNDNGNLGRPQRCKRAAALLGKIRNSIKVTITMVVQSFE